MPPNIFFAGYGGLSLSIEGPSKAEIQCKDNEDGTLNISYKPTEPGYYIVNLKFADHHVDGSPFTVKVGVHVISGFQLISLIQID
jgi:filamin